MERFPDIIPVVVSHLMHQLSLYPGDVATKVRADVDTRDAFIRVRRGPGSDDAITDSFLVDVETFTLSSRPAEAWPLAEGARSAMHALSADVLWGVLVDSVTTASAPTEIDYGNPKVVRYVASYRVRVRKVF